MRKSLLLTVVFGTALFYSCQKEELKKETNDQLKTSTACIQSPNVESFQLTKQLGPNINDVGDVSFWNDNDYVYVEIVADASFDNSKLYVGPCNSIPVPLNGSNNNVDHIPAVYSYTYMIPNTFNPGDIVCFSLGVSGNRKSSGSYMIEEICEGCDISLGDFRTQSKGGYGAPPNGSNPAAYMYDNWGSFGSVTVGCGSQTMTFDTPESVTAYLPNGNGSAAPFNSNLATQLVALSISVALDANVASFGASDDALGCLVMDSDDPQFSDFNGMTVNELIQLGNDVLGGCSSQYSFSQMTAVIDAVNLNYENGTMDNGHLTCGSCN